MEKASLNKRNLEARISRKPYSYYDPLSDSYTHYDENGKKSVQAVDKLGMENEAWEDKARL